MAGASSSIPPSVTRDMLMAQEELYDLLGISIGDTKGHSRSQSATGPTHRSSHMSMGLKSPYTRPLSDIIAPGFKPSSILGNRFTDDVSQISST
jgi:hypothetical protein